MVNNAFVKYKDKRIGAVSWNNDQGIAYFEYDSGFASTGWELSPFKMPLQGSGRIFSFPETRNTSTFKGLPGLLADVLPDKYGNALINAWLVGHGRSPDSLNPVETLCFIGKRGMGALEFEPAEPQQSDTSSPLELKELIQVAELILSGRKDFSEKLSGREEQALFEILKIGSSAGGARAKALVAYNEETGELRSGQTEVPHGFTHWLIKFDGVSDSQFGASSGYGRVEMAYYLMAKEVGIEIMESRLLEENGRAHFMTRRFDRADSGEKIHMQSFCALRHFDFNEVNLFSYEELFETMRMLGLSYPQAQELYRRMVFNVMSRNCDDHTKNFAFLMNSKGQWKLSPAFDLCHAYRPGSSWVSQHALSINGKRKDITREDLLLVGRRMNIRNAADIVEEIREVIARWDVFADEVKVDPVLSKAIKSTLLPM